MDRDSYDDERHAFSDRRSMADRVTRLEVEQANDRRIMRQHIASSSQLHQDNRTLIDSLDKRMDRQDLRFAWATGVIAAIVFLANIFGPVISRAVERAIN